MATGQEEWEGQDLNNLPIEIRIKLRDEAKQFAEEQHQKLDELKKELARRKLINTIDKRTETSLNDFLDSSCEKMEKDQNYVVSVAEQMFSDIQTTKHRYEILNAGASKMQVLMEQDTNELKKCIGNMVSKRTDWQQVKNEEDASFRGLCERTNEFEGASGNMATEILGVLQKLKATIEAQTAENESHLDRLAQQSAEINEKNAILERQIEEKKKKIMERQEYMVDTQSQLEQSEAEIAEVERQLKSRQQEIEMAALDQARQEQLLVELRAEAEQLQMSVADCEAECETMKNELSAEKQKLDGLNADLHSGKWDKEAKEQGERIAAEKAAMDAEVKAAEDDKSELERRVVRLEMKRDVMVEMFGRGSEKSPDDWRKEIEEVRQARLNRSVQRDERRQVRAKARADKESIQAELAALKKQFNGKRAEREVLESKLRLQQRRMADTAESRTTNISLAEMRLARANEEMLKLRTSKDADALLADPKTPVAPTRPHLSENDKVKPAGRGISDDSDGEIVTGMRFDIPGIVKRQMRSAGDVSMTSSINMATDTVDNTPILSQQPELTVDLERAASEEIARSMQTPPPAQKVMHWRREDDGAVDNNSGPPSDSTAAIMEQRYQGVFTPQHAEPSHAVLADTLGYADASSDVTLELDDGTLDLSMTFPMPTAEERASQAAPRQPPSPPARVLPSTIPSMFAGESDSDDANQSIWGEEGF